MSGKEKVLENLKFLLSVFGQRQVGHTTLLLNGTKNYDRSFGVISHKMDFSNEILNMSNNPLGKAFSINNLSALAGYRIPVTMDNAAWSRILNEVIHVIENSTDNSIFHETIKKEREEVAKSFSEIIAGLMEISQIYQERTHITESLILDYLLCKPWQFFKGRKIRKQIIEQISKSNKEKRIPEIFKSLNEFIKK
jgi:hypothetical protein